MSKTPSGPGTRVNSDHFLIGPEQSDLGRDARQGKLPTTRDVMKYFFYRKNLAEFKFKPVDSVICCPFKSGTVVSNCEVNLLCKDSSECVVSKLKDEGNWILSGIPIIGDLDILKRVKKLKDEY